VEEQDNDKKKKIHAGHLKNHMLLDGGYDKYGEKIMIPIGKIGSTLLRKHVGPKFAIPQATSTVEQIVLAIYVWYTTGKDLDDLEVDCLPDEHVRNCIIANRLIGLVFSESYRHVLTTLTNGKDHVNYEVGTGAKDECLWQKLADLINEHPATSRFHKVHLDPCNQGVNYAHEYQRYTEDHPLYKREYASEPLTGDPVMWKDVSATYNNLCMTFKYLQINMKASGSGMHDPMNYALHALQKSKMKLKLSPFNAYYFYIQCLSHDFMDTSDAMLETCLTGQTLSSASVTRMSEQSGNRKRASFGNDDAIIRAMKEGDSKMDKRFAVIAAGTSSSVLQLQIDTMTSLYCAAQKDEKDAMKQWSKSTNKQQHPEVIARHKFILDEVEEETKQCKKSLDDLLAKQSRKADAQEMAIAALSNEHPSFVQRKCSNSDMSSVDDGNSQLNTPTLPPFVLSALTINKDLQSLNLSENEIDGKEMLLDTNAPDMTHAPYPYGENQPMEPINTESV
jgi:hypothetical protein